MSDVDADLMKEVYRRIVSYEAHIVKHMDRERERGHQALESVIAQSTDVRIVLKDSYGVSK